MSCFTVGVSYKKVSLGIILTAKGKCLIFSFTPPLSFEDVWEGWQTFYSFPPSSSCAICFCVRCQTIYCNKHYVNVNVFWNYRSVNINVKLLRICIMSLYIYVFSSSFNYVIFIIYLIAVSKSWLTIWFKHIFELYNLKILIKVFELYNINICLFRIRHGVWDVCRIGKEIA